MKKITKLLLVFILSSSTLYAQTLEKNPKFITKDFDYKINSYLKYKHVENDYNYGVDALQELKSDIPEINTLKKLQSKVTNSNSEEEFNKNYIEYSTYFNDNDLYKKITAHLKKLNRRMSKNKSNFEFDHKRLEKRLNNKHVPTPRKYASVPNDHENYSCSYTFYGAPNKYGNKAKKRSVNNIFKSLKKHKIAELQIEYLDYIFNI